MRPGTPPHITRRERQLLEAIIVTGTLTLAAKAMEPPIVYGTARNYVKAVRNRTGYTTEQAIAIGVRDGWLAVREPLRKSAH